MFRKTFFDGVRDRLFGGGLSQAQVDGLNVLLDVWLSSFADHDHRWLAYCLATAKHETAGTMQPIREFGSVARANFLYGVEGGNPGRARRMGNSEYGDGARYKGRGYVQLTWKNNYLKAGRAIGEDLVTDPDIALKPDVAAQILFQGCIEGWFSGRSLREYIHAEKADYVGARKVINGSDRATIIAKYTEDFLTAIEEANSVSNYGLCRKISKRDITYVKSKSTKYEIQNSIIYNVIMLFRRWVM